jgi:hypothetical protein
MTDKYDWECHQQAVKNIALSLCIDVENGIRNSITFEVNK